MNKLFHFKIWSLAALTLCLAACSSDDEKVNAASELLNAEKEVAFAATETKGQINILADCPWEVTTIDQTGWQDLSIAPLSGEGNGTIILSTGQNHTSSDRTAVITLKTKGGLQQKVTILQTRSGADLKISQNTFDFSDAAGTQTLKIECNTDWEILGISSLQAYDTSWLKLSQLKGNGNAEVAISVLESFDDVERIARLTVSAGNLGDNYYNIAVTQQGKELVTMSTNVNSQTFAAAGSTKKVTVTSNGAWTATIPEGISWAHITPTSGIGNGEISITCDAYTGGNQDRMTVLTITAGSKTPQRSDVTITQTPN
ncbi:Putative binding domain-containing protein, N-terminal [Prevotella sp. ne3005]|uniref:BACON domain-containing protein n=1 Tax=Prevotella sp. ne3005 TaxID=1761887 RepID=UPI0008B066AE|nr:BACON domain-containing protein [Prevotella sp. ne3005]SEM75816.1 Putative binding domain-containing protein, N-terminal [Prevotella sp. ne3005]